MAAIDVCAAIGDAQKQYFLTPHDGAKQYAQKFISDEGKQNGLYWASPEGQTKSALGPLVAFATSEGFELKPDSHQPFHGTTSVCSASRDKMPGAARRTTSSMER